MPSFGLNLVLKYRRNSSMERAMSRTSGKRWGLTAAAMLLLQLWPSVGAAYDIVDIFNALNNRTCRASACDDVYFVDRKGDDYVVQKRNYQNVYELIVDVKRGYLRIGDEGMGGGNAVVTVMLYDRPTGPPLLLETVNTYSGHDIRSSSLGIYIFDKGKFEAAAHLFPDLRPLHFYRPGPVANFAKTTDLDAFVNQQNEDFIAFILPRHGTMIRSYLITFDGNACVKANWPEVARPEREAGCKTLATKTLGARTVAYNRSHGRFQAEALQAARPPRLGEWPD